MRQFPNVVMSPLHNTGSQKWESSFYLAMNQVFGITKIQHNDATYAAAINALPLFQAFVEPFAYHTIAAQSAICRCSFRITYYVKLFDPLQVTVS